MLRDFSVYLIVVALCVYFSEMAFSAELVSNGFDFPVGKPDGAGYGVLGYKFLGKENGVLHPGEDVAQHILTEVYMQGGLFDPKIIAQDAFSRNVPFGLSFKRVFFSSCSNLCS